jgi:VCBS repeat-containing protein
VTEVVRSRNSGGSLYAPSQSVSERGNEPGNGTSLTGMAQKRSLARLCAKRAWFTIAARGSVLQGVLMHVFRPLWLFGLLTAATTVLASLGLLAASATAAVPVALDDSYTTAEDTPLIVAAPGVLANDSDPDGDPLAAVLVSGPAHGTLTLNANGAFTYTPAANFNGTDSFTYRASDGTTNSNLATVTQTVTPVNDPPTVTVGSPGNCGGDDNSGSFLLTLADPDTALADLTLSATSNNEQLVPNANVALSGSGPSRGVSIAALRGGTGTAVVTITVSDGQITGSVTITVIAGGNSSDSIAGTSGADLLLGQNGNDTLNGLAGNDVLCGGTGDDNLTGGDNNDTVAGGQGDDHLTGGAGADRFSGGPGTDVLTDLNAGEGDTSDGS